MFKSRKWNLVFEGIITAIIILLLYLAAGVIVISVLRNDHLPLIRHIHINSQTLNEITPWLYITLTILALIVAGLVIFWRLRRRQRQYKLRQIINELHYIAEGHYGRRIRGNYPGDLGRIVDSIHEMVDSVVGAIEEERRVEQTKDELISNVSHDIRTPLTSILGYLALVNQGKYDSEQEAIKYVDVAYRKAKQMKVLVDDLFEYATVGRAEARLNLTTFDLVSMLEQLAVDFEIEARAKKIEISVHSSRNQLIMQGDAEKLARLFSNLITNAIKYGKQGRHIRIEIDRVYEGVKVYVKNDGVVMSKKAMEKVFDRFYREEKSRSNPEEGSGLGLAIVKSIAELHGGRIKAYVDHKWTVFDVKIPIKSNDLKKEEKVN